MTSSIDAHNIPQPPGVTSFHQVIANLLGISRIFAVLPVANITSLDVYRIHYRWLSLPTFIAAVIVLLNGLEFLTIINMVLKIGVTFHTVGALTFSSVCYLEQLMFWRLATKWPQIIQLWHRTEAVFSSHPYRLYATFNMSFTIKVLSGFLLVNTFLEHIMYLANAINHSETQRTECNTTLDFWENLYRNERTSLYLIVPFKVWMLPILEWINFSMTYTQSFTDIFIMSIGIGLATRLKQIHLRIAAVCEKPMPQVFWVEIRSNYMDVRNLFRVLDSNLSGLILVSCSYSLYFICLQLFNSFLSSGNRISTTFFWYSLIYVIGRTLLKLFAAAAIDDESRKILKELRNVPSISWGTEVERFCDQLYLEATAFSGYGYFYLTRKLIFAMAATIVTYELVLTDVVQRSGKQQLDLCFFN